MMECWPARLARPPRLLGWRVGLSEHRLAMAGRNNGMMGIEAEKIILMSQESFKPIIPLFYFSILPTGLPNGGQVVKRS